MSALKYRASRRSVGSLECIVVAPDSKVDVKAMVVLCHGFGAGGDDLVGLSNDLLSSRSGDEPVVLVYPAALLSLADEGYGDSRAWWRLSIQRLISAIEDGQYELIREESPEGIDAARTALVGTVNILLNEYDLDMSALVLGGFSQGAMLSMECACCGFDGPPAGLVLYSGCLIREKQWKAGADKLRDCSIVQSHGDQDMILPIRTGLWLKELLEESGCAVDFIRFVGPHMICGEAIERTAELIDEVAGRA
ncbi:MAG: lysophospholipase [Pirellulales bacterium]